MQDSAPLKGLLLCGGYSSRMQEDKSSIAYHGMPQWEYLVSLLSEVVPEVYISCRPDQLSAGAGFSSYPHLIADSVEGGGPAVGLISAHMQEPGTAWLVLACDLPLISLQSLQFLVKERDITRTATSFISPFNHLPEPLIAIWEPAGLAALQRSVLSGGPKCPRKSMLSGGDVKVLENPWPEEQFNANTPEEKAEALKLRR
ncbi:molybdenum cofactor guanylyltransferase [Chitinophaga jiangningensis]|uniref:Molybdenum cofactor guanylyltransferase n=1 Tax=Chitinophaga jiangningensis TaxID=1419482 RepID=A0A1M6X2T6_9BACT|nr:NTP transferase domain-containing protein [Chitinophaga jiangningensis]SHL00332.1 molybdenum cofactor guanylyltransferase [Chitinophaga jiangningensis]